MRSYDHAADRRYLADVVERRAARRRALLRTWCAEPSPWKKMHPSVRAAIMGSGLGLLTLMQYVAKKYGKGRK